MSSLTRLGWIGTGVMGRSMVRRLMKAGFDLWITTRTPERASELLDGGARWVDSPAKLVGECDAIISMVGYPRDVEDVYLGPHGVLTACEAEPRPQLLIDMTTSSPELARRIAERAGAWGIGSLDAPVSGGDVGARQGTLSVMVGGDEESFRRAEPIFEPLAGKSVLQGGPGAGHHTKMVNQILIAGTMVGVSEGIFYAERAGLDPERVIESVGGGAAGSWTVDNLVPRMLAGDFAPGFFVEHFIKDMGIALDEAERLCIAVPGLAQAKQLYEALRAQGHGRSGTQALLLALRHLSACDI